MMVNNDTLFDPHAVSELVRAALADPQAGIIVPKVFYYDAPRSIWAAGARYRRFPAAIVLKKTRGEDDGRFDAETHLEFTPFCVGVFSRKMLDSAGLLDSGYHFYYEDYDLCIRAKSAGFTIRFEPKAHIWHKISKTIRGGKKTEFWRVYGRSHGIFCQKFPFHPYVANRFSRWYLQARTLYEGRLSGLEAFRKAFLEGLEAELTPPPRWREVDEPAMLEVRLPGSADVTESNEGGRLTT